MTNDSHSSPGTWQHRVSRPARNRGTAFGNAHVTMGAIHMAGMIAGLLAADRMRSPAARWSAVAVFGIATGIGETIWRQRIERERAALQTEREDRD